jgi:hypothetical protein
MRCWGNVVNTNSTTTTLGGAIATSSGGFPGTPIIASATFTPTATTNVPWWFESEYTVLAIGAASTAQIIGQGLVVYVAAGTTTTLLAPVTQPTALATIFTPTLAQALVPQATWTTTATAGYTAYGYTVEQLN